MQAATLKNLPGRAQTMKKAAAAAAGVANASKGAGESADKPVVAKTVTLT